MNNAVARIGGLLAVAGLPAAVGLGASAYRSAVVFSAGFRNAVLICAGLLALGSLLSGLLIDGNVLRPAGGPPPRTPECRVNCPVTGPPLEPDERPVRSG